MRTPYQLVPDQISGDTVKALEEMLYMARKGQVIGLAFAAMYKHKQYTVDTTGEAARSPTFTRGMLKSLDDILSRDVHAGR